MSRSSRCVDEEEKKVGNSHPSRFNLTSTSARDAYDPRFLARAPSAHPCRYEDQWQTDQDPSSRQFGFHVRLISFSLSLLTTDLGSHVDSTVNNLGTVKKLHNCLFPVSYSDRFYQDSLNLDLSPEDFNKLGQSGPAFELHVNDNTPLILGRACTVFYQDLPVGVLISRIEPLSSEAPKDIDQAISNPSTEQNDENKEGYKLYIMTLGVLA